MKIPALIGPFLLELGCISALGFNNMVILFPAILISATHNKLLFEGKTGVK